MIINPLQWFEPVTPSTMELGLLSWLRFRSQSQIDAISAVEAGDFAWFRHCCLNCTHSFVGSSCGGWCACGRQRHVHRCMNLSGNRPMNDIISSTLSTLLGAEDAVDCLADDFWQNDQHRTGSARCVRLLAEGTRLWGDSKRTCGHTDPQTVWWKDPQRTFEARGQEKFSYMTR